MDEDFRSYLQSALGPAYAIERELGGGGMSRVFIATETAIGRRVVIKTLPPELAARLSVERFRREIQLAGGLQHPHIVPILTAGVADGLPYYTMPMVEGESLRARLSDGGALSIPVTIRVLREVVSALSYAHARGLVHRDIKPDNVLLSGEYAFVTDFGIAKALDDSAAPSSSLTSVGVAIGTPAYMAPEQAAADPTMDSRADLYSVGALAYEMLTGQAPFAGRSPQATLAAQLSETPGAVLSRRADVPPPLDALVMRLLAKEPADRPQTADEVLRSLDALITPASGSLSDMSPAARRAASRRAVGMYLGATVLAVALAWAAARVIGLPLWVIPGVALVMALGAPVIALSVLAHIVPSPRPKMTGQVTPIAMRVLAVLRPWLAWRRIALGGAGALALFGLFVAAFMVLRALGIGPSASLLAAGTLSARDRVIVVDFRSPPTDSTLGRVVSDAFRMDLEQSRAVSVVSADDMRDVLVRMKMEPGAHVDLAVAREIAVRDGFKAVVDGDVAIVGTTYIISARLISAANGGALAAYRETANGPDAVVPAIDRLSKRFRAKIGESLRSVNAAPPLDRVTTRSLEALRKYTEAWREQVFGDQHRSVALFEEAVALDTDFAMAWRRLSLLHSGDDPRRATAEMQHAMRLRDRLTPAERYLVMASDYAERGKTDSAIAAYEASFELQPDAVAWTNLLTYFHDTRQWKRGEEVLGALMPVDSGAWYLGTIAEFQFNQGRHAEAYHSLAAAQRREPTWWRFRLWWARYVAAEGNHDSALMLAHQLIAEGGRDRAKGVRDRSEVPSITNFTRAVLMTLGRLREARRQGDSNTAAQLENGHPDAKFEQELLEARIDLWYYGRPKEAVARVAAAEARAGLDTLEPGRREYLERAEFYARAGRADRAQALLSEWEAALPVKDSDDLNEARPIRGLIALARGHGESAVALLRQVPGQTSGTSDNDIARAYEMAGNTDSAIVLYQRAIADSTVSRNSEDQWTLASDLKRLGELYDARGNNEQALIYYGKFVALWKNADPELQPQVEQVKRRMRELASRNS